MPRINFIPPPMSFNDRGTALVSPIMANAMQLAETFTTEIPKIRMQQEGIAEDKRRFEIADATNRTRYNQEWERNEDRYKGEKARQGDLDFMQQHAGWEMLMNPDGIDLDADGKPDVVGNIGAKGGVTMPRVGTAKSPKAAKPIDYSKGADAWAANLVKPRVLKSQEIGKDPTTGEPIYRDINEDSETQRKRLYDAMVALRTAGDPASKAKARAILLQGSDPFEGPMLGDKGAMAIRDWALADDEAAVAEDATASAEAGATAGSGGTPADSRIMSMGSPVHSAMRRMLAMQRLDRLAASDPARRARLGLPSNEQIEQLKMQLSQAQQQQPQPGATGQDNGVGLDGEQGFTVDPRAEDPAAAAAAVAPAPAAAPLRPINLSMQNTEQTQSDVGGNDIAMAQWQTATGQQLDPAVLKSISDEISMATLKLQQNPDPNVRARSGEIQQAYMMAAAGKNYQGLLKLHNRLAKLNLFQQVPVKTTNLRIQE